MSEQRRGASADTHDDAHWLEILRHNHGFDEPEAWIGYARQHRFKEVPATPLTACPDCGSERHESVGQYVYYSSLVRLKRCHGCALVYADVRLPASIVNAHFEMAYKDEVYFTEARRAIFGAIAGYVSDEAPRGGRVIEIGGAKGHLLAALRSDRPDLDLVLNDISQQACAEAEQRHGLTTHCGSATELPERLGQFDVVILSDVLYYEPEIARLWQSLERATRSPGALILRLPNTHRLMLAVDWLQRRLSPQRARSRSAQWLFNPEHIYAFTREYLTRRLRSLGFDDVHFLPSPLLGRSPGLSNTIMGWLYRASLPLARISRGRLLASPSMLVVARRRLTP